MGRIMSICISTARGVQKKEIEHAALLRDFGIENDAHAGKWHRQVSLLSFETRENFRKEGAEVSNGAFGENLLVSGIDLIHLPIGARLCTGEVVLEVTQIGKECHSHCEIYHKMGKCIMPINGIFTKVISGGEIRIGDEISVCTESE